MQHPTAANWVEQDQQRFVDELASDPRAAYVHHRPARPGRIVELIGAYTEPARRLDVTGLWSHQHEALEAIRTGKHVAIATGTGSGKSLCYQLPIGAIDEQSPDATALALFPTKALAHDQLPGMLRACGPAVGVATYDGDTDREQRTQVRRNGRVVLTNAEMLHYSVLPHHRGWSRFLAGLRFVVVDELHTYRGVFGSHMAHVLRRLRRLCEFYGSSPQFIFSSATIGEADRLAGSLCGLEVEAVTVDGAPRAAQTLVAWRPDGSPGHDTGELVRRAVDQGSRAIAFCGSRSTAESVALHARAGSDRPIKAYRAGYLADERRLIETEFADGSVRGVVATSALELGVDIGGLDLAVLNGFPGTISSFRQQIGRVGRSGGASTAVLVAGNDQLDQWFIRHPDQLLSRPSEPAVINPANPSIVRPHLACAAAELPLRHEDEHLWPGLLDDGVRDLVRADLLTIRNRRAVWNGASSPAHEIHLRASSGGEHTIVDRDGTRIGTIGADRAIDQTHVGAVYTHQGAHYLVTDHDRSQRRVFVEPCGDEYRTSTRASTDLSIIETYSHQRLPNADQHLGLVAVDRQLTGYRRIDRRTGATIDSHDLDAEPDRLVTTALWWTFPLERCRAAGVTDRALPGALHALEHATIGLLPLFAICDRWDVGGLSIGVHPQTALPSVFIYDGYQGGVGVAELGFDRGAELLAAAAELISNCQCVDGCPSCVQSPKCGNGNDPLDKQGAVALAQMALESVIAA